MYPLSPKSHVYWPSLLSLWSRFSELSEMLSSRLGYSPWGRRVRYDWATSLLFTSLETPLRILCKEIQPVHPKGDQSWVSIGRTNAKAETLILWPPHAKSWFIGKKLWWWEGLGAGGEGDDRGWDARMASPTQWTWVWVNSRSWWWTGRPGVVRFMGSQRVGHDWATELNWTELNPISF